MLANFKPNTAQFDKFPKVVSKIEFEILSVVKEVRKCVSLYLCNKQLSLIFDYTNMLRIPTTYTLQQNSKYLYTTYSDNPCSPNIIILCLYSYVISYNLSYQNIIYYSNLLFYFSCLVITL